ncbi:hypothetical protein [Caulobacter sp. RHG1]|uniref:hypothetical protein n=1 Tax=Caulobacter sp. (strain RHG1) TaxID=2545762 RepID=UPI0015532445|nr:hypothetical protein [Caulobacter sp. RHG1]
MNRLLVSALALPLLLTACEAKKETPPAAPAEERTVATAVDAPAPAPAAFQHDPALELVGFYFVETQAQVARWRLMNLSVGQPADFAAWEAGKRDPKNPPITLIFANIDSPAKKDELEQTIHQTTLTLVPDSYQIDDQRVFLHANTQELGEVVLELTPDLAAYKAARTAGPNGGAQRVFTGSLQIGAERIRNISFFHHPGE